MSEYSSLLLAGVCSPYVSCKDGGDNRHNIAFLLADDHSFQAVSWYGAVMNHTPDIDRIAREGMIFRYSIVTHSINAPCRAGIRTGKFSHFNSINDNNDPFYTPDRVQERLLMK